MTVDIKKIAPTLTDSGLSEDEIAFALRPKDPPKPTAVPIAAKRYRMLLAYFAKGIGVDEAARMACVPLDVAQAVADEVGKATDALADLEPIPAETTIDAQPDFGKPKPVEPTGDGEVIKP